MVLDLNRILRHATIDGRLSETQQRTIYSLTDAIVCGQGNGPFAPEPLPVGAVTFASHSVVADWVHCVSLGLDPDRLPLVPGARRLQQSDGPCWKQTVSHRYFRIPISIDCRDA